VEDTEGEKDTKTTMTSDMLGGEKQQQQQLDEEESVEAWIVKSLSALQAALKPIADAGKNIIVGCYVLKQKYRKY
jgi:hypothetical protein